MKKLSAVLIAAVIALSAAGCSAQDEAAPQAASESSGAAPTSAPITMAAEEPAATESASPYGDHTQDEFYVLSVAPTWQGAAPSDSALIAAGHLACDKLTAGESADSVVVVEGADEEAARNNEHVVQYAIQVYCPEFEVD